jgi:hypothetical protein
MMGPNGGLRDPHVLQHAAQINACEITYLDRDQAPHQTEPRGEAERHGCRNALDQDDSDHNQKRSHGKHGTRDRSGNKMKCYRGYQSIPPQA